MATIKQKPANIIDVPEELRGRKQWVLWRVEERNGKPTKVPYQVDGTKAESNNPSTWGGYEDICAVADLYSGIGIMFADGLAGIDLDHCINERGEIDELARYIVERIDTYTEYSPSDTGLHLLFFGDLPKGRRKNTEKGFEIYSKGRFFTFTGKHLRGTPMAINERTEAAADIHRDMFPEPPEPVRQPTMGQLVNLDDQTVINLAMDAKNGAKFAALYAGDITGYSSQSEADLALCAHLAFWTGGDTAQIDRIFRASRLMRPKWDERHGEDTYGVMTITKAVSGTSEFYTPPLPEAVLDDSTIEELAARRFVIRDMAYALQPQPPREWRVRNLLPAGHVGMLSAWTGSGKTWIAYEMAVCHALGRDWMDFKTIQGACLIINEEMDDFDMYNRLAMCNRAHFGDEHTPVRTISFARFNLFTERTATIDAAMLEQAIEETNAKFVIIDALADLMAGGDENAVKDTQQVFMRLSDIAKRTRCVILVLHHTGKNGATRGSSAIPGAVDLAILMKRSPDSPFVNFETEKARVIPAMKWTGKMIWVGDEQFYTERFEKENDQALTTKEQAVIEYLMGCKDQQAFTVDISKETGVSRYTIINLSKRHKITRLDDGGHGSPALWGVSC